MQSPFTAKVIEIIGAIPRGRVSTYGIIAAHAGSPQGARQVVRILHSSSGKYNLPWHRVVNRSGGISLRGNACAHQKALLAEEGVEFEDNGAIDLSRFLWWPKAW